MITVACPDAKVRPKKTVSQVPAAIFVFRIIITGRDGSEYQEEGDDNKMLMAALFRWK